MSGESVSQPSGHANLNDGIDANKLFEQTPENMAELQLTRDGWLLKWRDRAVLIFDDILSLEADDIIAKEFGVSKAEAWKLRSSALDKWWPKSLDELRLLFPKVIGEDENIKLIIDALTSLKLKDREERLMGAIILAKNSAGKNHLAGAILEPFRSLQNGEMVIEFTRVTGPFLERNFADKNLDRRILFIQETQKAPTQLHLILSEGKLRVGLVEKVNGEFHPIEIEAEGQPFLLATSTGWRGSPDLIHRCIIVNLDESKDQTLRIRKFDSKLASDLIYRRRFKRFVRGCVKVFVKLWKEIPKRGGCNPVYDVNR